MERVHQPVPASMRDVPLHPTHHWGRPGSEPSHFGHPQPARVGSLPGAWPASKGVPPSETLHIVLVCGNGSALATEPQGGLQCSQSV